MITYEEFKKKYGDTNTKTGMVRAGVSKEVFGILNTEENFGPVLSNHVGAILIKDVVTHINQFLIVKCGQGKGSDYLDAYKKLGHKFKDVIRRHTEASGYILSDRYYEYSPEIEERTFFRENVGKKVANKIVAPMGHFEEFYYAINTKIGQDIRKILSEEKVNVLARLYKGNKNTNGMSPYFTIIIDMEADWNNRIKIYERSSKNLKLINRSVGYGR